MTEIAAEFVQLKVDVIVTTGAAALAAKQTTSVIPIVFAVANDPIGSGLVAGLARPGGNVTGLSVQAFAPPGSQPEGDDARLTASSSCRTTGGKSLGQT